MVNEPDLFNYPHTPGYQNTDTSRQAAEDISPAAPTLRGQVLYRISQAGDRGLTADEAAHILQEGILSIRPRVTELNRLGRIEDTGERRLNTISGKKAIVWRIRQ